MKNFFKLFLITSVMVFAMSVISMAETHSDVTYTASETLTKGDTYHCCSVEGSSSADDPVVIKIPAGGVIFSGKSYGHALEIKSGHVRIEGEEGAIIYHNNITGTSAESLIKIDPEAELTISNVTVSFRKEGFDASSVPINERLYYGIVNEGTLNINEGAVISNFGSKGTGFALSSVINTKGTLNINGGVIKNNKLFGRAGNGIYMQGDVNITNGLIYDNSGYSITCVSGKLNMSGGLILGQIAGSYNNGGTLHSGVVDSESASVFNSASELRDQTQGISIPLSEVSPKNSYLTADPLHNIFITSGGKSYRGLYSSNKWHFYEEDHGEHKVELVDTEVFLSLTDESMKSKVLEAEVICPDGHTIQGWSCSTDGIVSLQPDGNKCTITALKRGTTKVKASAHDGIYAECEVTVTDGNVIDKSTTLNADEVYTDLILDGKTNGLITVTIPVGGITVASSGTDKSCITVKGAVTLNGSNGEIYHINSGAFSSYSIIKVEPGANLSIYEVDIYGVSKAHKDQFDDTDHSHVETAENVKYGVYNEGTVAMYGYSSISRVHADDEIDQDGVIYNKGSFVMGSGSNATIHNNYNCYVIYSDGGTQTMEGGAIVGQIPEGTTIGGHNGSVGAIYGLAPGTKLTVGSSSQSGSEVFNQKEVIIKAGESLITRSSYVVRASVGGKTINGKYVDGRWEFTESVDPSASFVKQTGKDYEGDFNSSHIKTTQGIETNEDTGAENTVATFFDKTIDAGNTHILCDIFIPAGSESYIKTDKESIESFTLTSDDGIDGIKKAVNPDNHTIRVAYPVGSMSGSQFGVLVNNIYMPSAKAYIIACTEEQYNSATHDGYYSIASSVEQGEGIAPVSLD